MPDRDGFAHAGATNAGGYTNWVREVENSNKGGAVPFYENIRQVTTPAVMPDSTQIQALADTYFRDWYATLPFDMATKKLASFAGLYDAGTSLMLRNMLFAPVAQRMAGAPTTWTPNDYQEVSLIVAEAQGLIPPLTLYGELGFANNPITLLNEVEYELTHPHIEHTGGPSNAGRYYKTQGLLPKARTAISLASAWPGYDWLPTAPVTLLPTTPAPARAMLEYNSTVLADVELSLEIAIRKYGKSANRAIKRFLIGGEGFTTPFLPNPNQARGCPYHLVVDNCLDCRPLTNYSPAMREAFIGYMVDVVLPPTLVPPRPPTIRDLNLRWGTRLEHFSDIDPDKLDCVVAPKAVQDFIDCQFYHFRQVQLFQYRVAKREEPIGEYAVTTLGDSDFGTSDLEFSWLHSDLPDSLDWYNLPTDRFFAEGWLFRYGAITRMGGVPWILAPTGPPGFSLYTTIPLAVNCSDGVTVPPILNPQQYLPRCADWNDVRLYFRDVLMGGASHIGFYKAPYFSYLRSKDWPNVFDEIRRLKSIRDERLRFTSLHQAVVVHLDLFAFAHFQEDQTRTELAPPVYRAHELAAVQELVGALEVEQVAYAMFNDDEVRERRFARDQIAHSVTFAPFHAALADASAATALLDTFETLLLAKSPAGRIPPGILVGVVNQTRFATLQGLPKAQAHVGTSGGGLPQIDWNGSGKCFVLAVADRGVNETVVQYAQSVRSAILPDVRAYLDDPARLARVLTFTNQSAPQTAVLQSTYVTDGLCFMIAVSNRDTSCFGTPSGPPVACMPAPATFTLAMHANLLARLPPRAIPSGNYVFVDEDGVTSPGSVSVTLAGKETKFYWACPAGPISGTPSQADLDAKANEFGAVLDPLEASGFEVAHGRRLISNLVNNTRLSGFRKLAGLVRLSKMLFLKASRTSSTTLVVEARQIWGLGSFGPAPAAVPVEENALDLQVLHLLNGHERQAGVSPRWVNGKATVTLTDPTKKLWDPDTGGTPPGANAGYRVVPEARLAASPVFEVHVHDRVTGAHAFAVVT